MNGIALVIPTWNEKQSIGPLIAEVREDSCVDRIIVADGGSCDGTVALATEAGAEVLHAGRGYGRACWLGAEAAGPACDIIVFMDGDGSDCPKEIEKLTAPIRAGTHDFVIGSRVRGEREPGSMNLHQVLAGRVIGAVLRRLYGVAYTDMAAFRAIRRDALLTLGMREMTYGWNLEMQMRAARSGLRILEIPVSYRCRRGDESKVAGSLSGSLKAARHIIATFLRVFLEAAPAAS